MNVRLAVFLASAICLLAGCAKSPFAQIANKDVSNYSTTYILPINVTANPRIELVVEPPKDMSTQQQSIQSFLRSKESAVAYTTKIDRNKVFSKYLAIMKFIGKGFTSKQLLAMAIDESTNSSPRVEVIRYEITTEKTYEHSMALIQYTIPSGTPSLLYIEMYSGPYDACGVVQSELLDGWLTGSDREQRAAATVQSTSSYVHLLNNGTNTL